MKSYSPKFMLHVKFLKLHVYVHWYIGIAHVVLHVIDY